MADHLKKRGADVVVEILRRKFFLTEPRQSGTHIGGELVGDVAGNCMYKHKSVLASGIYAAESRIHVLVMSLKPITERGTQHACRSARRAALHDEVLAIKKICGISVIKRERLEA